MGGRAVRVWLGVAVLTVATLAGCAGRPDLEPGPGARPAPPGPGKGAMGSVNGITIVARSDAWAGFPPDLEEVTPVLVTITNDGKAPVRLRYNEFSLVAPTGQRYAAIPPFNVRGTEVEPIEEVAEYSGFRVAPYHARYYPWLEPYAGEFPFDEFYYSTYYPRFVRIELPTGDMIQKALPEGVLEPGGSISGFLYFENVGSDVKRVDFTADLVNAATGRHFGAVRIPFSVG